jgi:hypothetical protein
MAYRVAAKLAVVLALMLAPAAAWAQTCQKGETDSTARAIPQALAPAVIATFHANMTPEEVTRNGVIRCDNGYLSACLTGANLNCGKANTSKVNRGAEEWCRTHPSADFVPLFASGHDSIYAWRCNGTLPVISRQVGHVDHNGFVTEHWRRVGQ